MIVLPFAGGIESTPNATLLFSLAAAIIYASEGDARVRPSRLAARAGSIALLALLALVQSGPLLLIAALALGAAAAALQSRDDRKERLAGLGAHFAANLVYALLFASGGGAFGLEPWRGAAALAMVLLLLVMFRLSWPYLEAGLRPPVAAGHAITLAMGIAALATGAPTVVAGTILLMASDALQASERALPDQRQSAQGPVLRRLAWIGHYCGHLAITLGVLLA